LKQLVIPIMRVGPILAW